MKARDFVGPSIVLVVLVTIISQFFWATPEKRKASRQIRAEKAEKKTKEFLEQSARGEMDVLSEKYDLDILQDQLNKNKVKAHKL